MPIPVQTNPPSPPVKTIRVAKWYFGGIAGVGATCITHPLDLIKVQFQMQQGPSQAGILRQQFRIIRRNGFFALYSGLSAALLRQVTYTTTRIGIYEMGKQHLIPPGENGFSFLEKVALAGIGGAIGGMMGAPGDLVKIRMQNDIVLPPDKRRNYKNVIDGLIRVYREEGFRNLWSASAITVMRSSAVTVGQLCTYDQIKIILLSSGAFQDGVAVHFLSSLAAGTIATFMTQPLDVLRTRQMNARPGEFRNIWQLIRYTAECGLPGFFKGFFPAFLRLGPHTVIMFEIMEQLRKNFGTIKEL